MKQIRLTTKTPLEIDAASLVEAVNDLRKNYGEKKNKAPLELAKILPKINLFKNRDSDHGMLSFRLSYEDEGRDFPNFGLEVKSESKLEQRDNKLFLSVDMTIKAGKPKWQLEEISECGKIFKTGRFKLGLNVTLDETTEWGGHSASVTTAQDTPDAFGINAIAASNFFVETK